jgi:putative transposase
VIAKTSYFFTVALAERWGQPLIKYIRGLRTAFREVKAAHPSTLEAAMILPDHWYCSWALPQADNDFPTRWRQIKGVFSRQLLKAERRSKSQRQKGERGIWQRRFGEHLIRVDTDYRHHKVAALEACGS